MYELFYDDDFTEYKEKIIYNKQLSQMPNSFLKFIKNITESLIICDEKNNINYCSKCFNKISNSMYCDTCNIYFHIVNPYIIYIDNIKEEKEINDNYYYFDIVDNSVIVYCIKREISFYSKDVLEHLKELSSLYDSGIHKSKDGINYSQKIDIKWVIQIKKNQIYDLINNTIFSYIDFYNNGLYSGYGHIYTNNLDKLKDTSIFKYKPLWKCKNYLKTSKSIKSIIHYSLTNECFEYLVNLKLYNLAFSICKFKGNFEKTLGIDKSYLDFMVKNNIDSHELRVLKLLKVKDISLIKSLSRFRYIDPLEKLKKEYNINILKLVDYFNKNKIEYKEIPNYYEYIKMISELKYNIQDKNIIYPKNFDNTFYAISEIYYSQIDEDIKRIGNLLDINKYEDDKYIIYPPKLAINMIDEANQQSNCLLTYITSYSKGESQIYFMRKKDEIDKSLVTIEVENNKVIQALTRYNEEPSSSLLKVVKKWEENLIPIDIT